MSNDRLEIYQAYIGDLGNIGTRYATSNGFYLSVASALLAILAFAETGKPLEGIASGVGIAISLFGIVICWIWRTTIDYYGTLFGAKFQVLRSLEEQLPFGCFTVEWEHIKGTTPLLKNERRVPFALGVLFVALAVAFVGQALCVDV